MRDRFSRSSLAVAAFAMLAACSGGSGNGPPTTSPTTTPPSGTPTNTPAPVILPTNTPTMTPSGVPTSTPVASNAAAFVCPTSNSASTARVGTELARRGVAKFHATSETPSLLEVTYATSSLTRTALATRETTLGVHAARETTFDAIGRTTRLVPIGNANLATLMQSFRSQAGVLDVSVEGARRHPMAVTTSYYPNDPYFNGFTTTVAPSNTQTAPPATYHVGPFEERDDVPGQWNMHAIGLEKAFAYSQSGNGSGITNAGALGSSNIKLAIIDTGADTTIPELSGKVVKQGCFITNPSNVQSTGNFVTDPDGHGTDTSGIAAQNTGNGIGFSAAGGNVSLMEWRVDPTPDDACLDESTSGNDPQCSANVTDVADAIIAATNAGANVISLSLGGGGCTSSGADDDSEEGNALAQAFAKNVVVVASAGNDGANTKGSLAAPGCVSGVIGVGASALSDGVASGSGSTAGTVTAPVEYVASYSQYGTPSANVKSANAWGIVAPGGDPSDAEAQSGGTIDDLHWIIDVYTSTPVDASYAGSCHPDYPNGALTTGTIDCRILIAGTSMSAPTVGGAAALILSANTAYQSPSAMKSLLCTTADDINDAKEGCGRLNVYRAMAKAVGDSNAP